MRHFLFLTLPIFRLSGGMIQLTLTTFLIALAGLIKGFFTGSMSTISRTVNMATITVTANQNLACTASTIEHSSGIYH